MDLNDYQRMAEATDQVPTSGRGEPAGTDILVPLLGLREKRVKYLVNTRSS